MRDTNQTVGQYFKVISLIHAALVAGLLLFALVSTYINSSTENLGSENELNKILSFVAPLMAITCAGVGIFLFKQQMKSASHKNGLHEKLKIYLAASIIKYALLEGPALFALVAYFITANYFFLGVAGVLILVLALERPSKFKAINDLNLNPAERKQIENPNTILTET